MTLGHLITLLEKIPFDLKVKKGFENPHSWRGAYDELAFEPVDNTTIGEMLSEAKKALNNTYAGYKGDNFTVNEWTDVHIDFYGSSGDSHLFDMWLNSAEAWNIANEENDKLRARVVELEKAIENVGSWLSAVQDDPKVCKECKDAFLHLINIKGDL